MQIRIFINRRKITKSTEIFWDFQISHKYINIRNLVIILGIIAIKRLIKHFH